MKKEHFEQMKKKTEEILKQKTEGVSAREIMAQIYVNNLEDKSMKQGLMMADKALEAIADFNQTYAKAVENKEGTLNKLIDQMVEGKTVVERCNTLSALYVGVSAASAKIAGESAEDCNTIMKQADEKKITEDQATPELEAELKSCVLKALEESSVLSRGLIRQADYLDAMMEENGVTQMVLQIGQDETEYEGILTMLAYVESKNENIEELPPDITVEEMAYIVAATMEEKQIVKRYTAGEIAMEVAVALLDILGIVLLAKLALKLILLGVALATSLCGMIMAVPAAILVTLSIVGVVGEAIRVWNIGAKGIVHVAVAVIKIGAKVASAGFRKIGEFVKNTIVPIAGGIVKKIKSFFATLNINTHVVTVNNIL